MTKKIPVKIDSFILTRVPLEWKDKDIPLKFLTFHFLLFPSPNKAEEFSEVFY